MIGHRAVRNDPTPDGEVQIGVGIVQHRAAMAGNEAIHAEAQRSAAARGRSGCGRTARVALIRMLRRRETGSIISIRQFVIVTKAARQSVPVFMPGKPSVSHGQRNP